MPQPGGWPSPDPVGRIPELPGPADVVGGVPFRLGGIHSGQVENARVGWDGMKNFIPPVRQDTVQLAVSSNWSLPRTVSRLSFSTDVVISV